LDVIIRVSVNLVRTIGCGGVAPVRLYNAAQLRKPVVDVILVVSASTLRVPPFGKGHTEYVPQKRAKEDNRRIATHRKFRESTQEWVNLAIELCRLKITQAGQD
jgi:hypothetical protein